jgi:hypothetical protein
MKRMKFLVALLLTLILLPFQGAIPAQAQTFVFPCGSGGTYTVEQPSGVLLSNDKCAGYVKIDSSVVEIKYKAFEYSKVTEVFIPDSVKVIHYNAFAETTALKIVRLPSNLKEIQLATFVRSGIESISIPATVTRIGLYAFYESMLTSVDIPDTVSDISGGAFGNIKGLSKIIYCGTATGLPITPTCPPDRRVIADAAIAKAAADKAAADKAAADKAAADKAAAAKAAADKIKADADAIQAEADAIQASQDAKQLTITCKKGSVTKKVRGESPKCPKGYVNPIGNLLTFKAFSECQLYKKDATLFGVGLINSGKTLIIENPNNWEGSVIQSNKVNRVTFSDLDCAFDYMGASERVRDIYSYKAVNGVRTIRWGKITLRVEQDFLGLVTYTFRQS